jgi:hypothetical protein
LLPNDLQPHCDTSQEDWIGRAGKGDIRPGNGYVRRASTFNRGRIDHISDATARAAGMPEGRTTLHYGDLGLKRH